ncbi:hypothetical protein MTR67_038758 [Solanum verrucosum]|uniref:Uncharacterized protein n=1 Tax=Solanum verrucosum TaxID=315347 RepID=A0AAF0UGH1_SOLVR|nr:hypothetical protein MTR67_038758 [Solanum verrucosum]
MVLECWPRSVCRLGA